MSVKSTTTQLKRKLKALSSSSRRATRRSNASRSTFDISFLPRNDELEQAIALAIYHRHDARSKLHFVKTLMNATLLSLASPVGQWDPYDIKPQIFALDTFIALPVFTSIDYLREYCCAFDYTVRDPSGNLWVDPTVERTRKQLLLGVHSCASSGGSSGNADSINREQQPTTDLLFDMLNEVDANISTEVTREILHSRKKSRKTNLRKPKVEPENETNNPHARTVDSAFVPPDLWERVRQTKTFEIRKSTPLSVFGPTVRPYFVGYFADTETLLQNVSIAPQKVDIVLNPSSPLEIAVAREASDRVLHRDTLILQGYQQLEKQLRREFHHFFLRSCPEVLRATSACIAKAHNSELFHNYVEYQIVIVVDSAEPMVTWERMAQAKRRGDLEGHADLEVLPLSEAAPHVLSGSTMFFSAALQNESDERLHSRRKISNGRMIQVGAPSSIAIGVDTDSFYSDPTNFYTEAGSVFTDDLASKS